MTFLLEAGTDPTVLGGLVANSPVAAGLILAMWLFLRYLGQRDASMEAVLKANTQALIDNSRALAAITTAVQYCQSEKGEMS